ncbi:DEAD/DEAH box helicase family protein [soil metagenome]
MCQPRQVANDRRIDDPILNSPFDVPTRQFRFDEAGITDEIAAGRRRSEYVTPIPAVKRRRGATQAEMEFPDERTDRLEENVFINQVRAQVDLWRGKGHPGVTATTRRLLEHWTDPTREKGLFFCQVEALETAIYLAEFAHRDTGGAFLQNQLRTYADAHNPGLFRLAHKMATGTGKTVVMARTIAWHTLNKAANPQDGRFTDAFLVVCPGITIRDRLRVLEPAEPDNYYDERDLVPPELRSRLARATVVITNYHAFLRREKVKAARTTKAILTRGRPDTSGVFTETAEQVALRVCRPFRGRRSIVVLNDEAHHCYKPRPPAEDAPIVKLSRDEKAEIAKEEASARVWAGGLDAVHAKVGVKTVYDLSATPFFLAGSGYREGGLFPWVVSDFSLVDAIEAGLVKIPRVPVDDDAAQSGDGGPTYRNLWPHVRDHLPKKRRVKGERPAEPVLPAVLEGALRSLYANYAKAFARWDEAATSATPPVFIVVCNNTTVSKLVFDWIAGHERPPPEGEARAGGAADRPALAPGNLDLFSTVAAGGWTARPATILVDSAQLESGDAMSAEFKAMAAPEIAELKADHARRYGAGAAEEISDEDLLREVMNTVGKPGRLGEQVRCVVSVSMLTEGWDANTVTHILGVRAFGTQLLCEQVVGRGLRRRSYATEEQPDGSVRFAPEYAEVYGIPFSFIPTSGSGPEPLVPKPTTRVRALPERDHLAIAFPHVLGYRWEVDDDQVLAADFGEDSELGLSSRDVPSRTEVEGLVGEHETHTLADLEAVRPQQVAFALARRLLHEHFRGGTDTQPKVWLFPTLLGFVRQWMTHPHGLQLHDNAFPGWLMLAERQADAVGRIHRGIVGAEGGFSRLLPVLREWEPVGSTTIVDFETTKVCWPTSPDRCPVSHVAEDSGWETRVAQALEELPEVVRYVKNQGMGFTVPYTAAGRARSYVPDFIACIDDGHRVAGDEPDDLLHLIVEVTGQRRDDKVTKVATTRELWVPAVNNHGGFGRWAVAEVTDPFDAHRTVRDAVRGATAIGNSRVV